MSPDTELDILLTCEKGVESENGVNVAEEEDHAAGPDEALEPPASAVADASAGPPAPAGESVEPVPEAAKEASPQSSLIPPISINVAGFVPHRSGLTDAQILVIAKLAREIVGQQGNQNVVRTIRLVGNGRSAGEWSTSLANGRVASVRMALQLAIEHMWPRLTQNISFVSDIKPAGDAHSFDRERRIAQKESEIEIILETGQSKTPTSYPAVVSVAPGRYAWQTRRLCSEPTGTETVETQRGKALRASSNEGFFYVLSPDVAPSRWVCSLELNLEPADHRFSSHADAIKLRATGLLISPRHIFTVGHGLYCRADRPRENVAQDDGTERVDVLTAASATVMLAHNSLGQAHTRISVKHRRSFRSSALWRVSRATNTEFDFGLITLPHALPASIGFWGGRGHRIAPVADDRLRNATVETVGYPELQHAEGASFLASNQPHDEQSTQWATLGIVTRVCNRRLFHDMPVRPGQDGSPVWIRTGTQRALVGIIGVNKQMVRITPRLLARLRAWMAQDGVRPSF